MTARFDIHLVRHGQSTWNALRRVQGQTPHVPLTALGARQAADAARRLAACGARAVYSSDLRRAAETALPIARMLAATVTLDPDLRERSLGEFEGQRSAAAWTAAGAEWGDPWWRPPHGESIHDVRERARAFLRRLNTRADRSPVVVVTHGDTAGILIGLLRGYPEGTLPRTALANGEIITLACGPPAGPDGVP